MPPRPESGTDPAPDPDILADRLAREPLPGSAEQLRLAPARSREARLRGPVGPHGTAAVIVLLHPPASASAPAPGSAAESAAAPDPVGRSFPLIVRPHDAPRHPGQVALPGGRLCQGESPGEAALRELWEELGVDPAAVRVLGRLTDLWVPASGFLVHPFVGWTDSAPRWRPDPGEVAAVIDAPLGDFLGLRSIRPPPAPAADVPPDAPFYSCGGRAVWGATAMILRELAAVVVGTAARPATADDA
jgi:8-oxo-dGTP pyrophosphatase MutT (NUDIX family)